MVKQERAIRQMDRDLDGAVVVINTDIARGNRDDVTSGLARAILEESRIHVGEGRTWICEEREEAVAEALDAAIAAGSRVILTIGGTGISRGDITPEVTQRFLEVRMDGIAQQIRDHGLLATTLASLSRGLVGVTRRGRGGVLVVNAPGSRGGVKDALDVVCPLLPHIFEQLDDQGA